MDENTLLFILWVLVAVGALLLGWLIAEWYRSYKRQQNCPQHSWMKANPAEFNDPNSLDFMREICALCGAQKP